MIRRLLGNLSYRYKVPLVLSLVMLATGALTTLTLVVHSYQNLRGDLTENAISLGEVVARTLTHSLKHDDLWRAFQVISVPYRSHHELGGQETLLVVLDRDQRIFVSNRPEQYRTATLLPDYLTPLAQAIREESHDGVVVLDPGPRGMTFILVPIIDDDDPAYYGTLLIGFSPTLLTPRFYAMVWRATLGSLIVLLLLLPLGWYLGKRMVAPLSYLADCLGRVGNQPPSQIQCKVSEGRDEIGRLGATFRHMIGELRHKETLEQEVMMADRLAAIGRISAGIAHEINNPLGGMLNAISTHRRYGSSNPVTNHTVDLLERGLLQIRETVSALLVEACPQQRELTKQDIEDIRTLLSADIESRVATLRWQNRLRESIPLSATLVRQVLINLLLNAVQAIPDGGHITCRVACEEGHLLIDVRNNGPMIPQHIQKQLFEPFVHHKSGGRGLGLWVSYQVTRQLGGTINVTSNAMQTRFRVKLPLPETPEG